MLTQRFPGVFTLEMGYVCVQRITQEWLIQERERNPSVVLSITTLLSVSELRSSDLRNTWKNTLSVYNICTTPFCLLKAWGSSHRWKHMALKRPQSQNGRDTSPAQPICSSYTPFLKKGAGSHWFFLSHPPFLTFALLKFSWDIQSILAVKIIA